MEQFHPTTPRRIISPNEVRTLDTHSERRPDRMFYILHGEHVWECDGYCVKPDEGERLWTILLMCPVCRRNLKIDSTKKKLQIDERGLELDEPIACPYPGEFGAPCAFKVAIVPPTKRDEKRMHVTDAQGITRELIIDAVAKRI